MITENVGVTPVKIGSRSSNSGIADKLERHLILTFSKVADKISIFGIGGSYPFA